MGTLGHYHMPVTCGYSVVRLQVYYCVDVLGILESPQAEEGCWSKQQRPQAWKACWLWQCLITLRAWISPSHLGLLSASLSSHVTSCHIMSDFYISLTDGNEASELPLKAGRKGRGASVSSQYKRSQMIKNKALLFEITWNTGSYARIMKPNPLTHCWIWIELLLRVTTNYFIGGHICPICQ